MAPGDALANDRDAMSNFPLQVHFLSLPPSEAVEARVRERFEALERFSSRIQSCFVRVEKPRGHHRKGPLYEVQVRVTVPRKELVIASQPPEEDVTVAIRNAFDATRRKLEDYERRKRDRLQARPRRHGRAADRGAAPEASRRKGGRS